MVEDRDHVRHNERAGRQSHQRQGQVTHATAHHRSGLGLPPN